MITKWKKNSGVLVRRKGKREKGRVIKGRRKRCGEIHVTTTSRSTTLVLNVVVAPAWCALKAKSKLLYDIHLTVQCSAISCRKRCTIMSCWSNFYLEDINEKVNNSSVGNGIQQFLVMSRVIITYSFLPLECNRSEFTRIAINSLRSRSIYFLNHELIYHAVKLKLLVYIHARIIILLANSLYLILSNLYLPNATSFILLLPLQASCTHSGFPFLSYPTYAFAPSFSPLVFFLYLYPSFSHYRVSSLHPSYIFHSSMLLSLSSYPSTLFPSTDSPPTNIFPSFHYFTSPPLPCLRLKPPSLPPSQWNLVCENKYRMSLIQSTYMGGVLTGAVVLSELADKWVWTEKGR